ncbi:hypothetical protein KFL_001110220 [Klebsormidium nitens]|uniref:PHD-type domain-containing protein n=1 Tax=Klebsormidium nitens TaxID=105231 RepID=A0A1Y1I0Z9_KLENI|nr:hypothetical protein KFL_001110220 [Klebsormidium nitens]|eukprot:GAQ82446.1 hypothetical protein KFL_001110220 [Klebsormidium nitens]
MERKKKRKVPWGSGIDLENFGSLPNTSASAFEGRGASSFSLRPRLREEIGSSVPQDQDREQERSHEQISSAEQGTSSAAPMSTAPRGSETEAERLAAAIWKREHRTGIAGSVLTAIQFAKRCMSSLIFDHKHEKQTTTFGRSCAETVTSLKVAEDATLNSRKVGSVNGVQGSGKSTMMTNLSSCEDEESVPQTDAEAAHSPEPQLTIRISQEESKERFPRIESFVVNSYIETFDLGDGKTWEKAVVLEQNDLTTGQYTIRYLDEENKTNPSDRTQVRLCVDPPKLQNGYLLARPSYRVATVAEAEEYFGNKEREMESFGEGIHALGNFGDSSLVPLEKTYTMGETKVVLRGFSKRLVAYYIHQLMEEKWMNSDDYDTSQREFSAAELKRIKANGVVGRRIIGVPEATPIEDIPYETICCFQEQEKAIGKAGRNWKGSHEGRSEDEKNFLFRKLCKEVKLLTTQRLEADCIFNDLCVPLWHSVTESQPDSSLPGVVMIDNPGDNFVSGTHELGVTVKRSTRYAACQETGKKLGPETQLGKEYLKVRNRVDALKKTRTSELRDFAVKYLQRELGIPRDLARQLVKKRMEEAFQMYAVCLRYGRKRDHYDGHGSPGEPRMAPEDVGMDALTNFIKKPPLSHRPLKPVIVEASALLSQGQAVLEGELGVFRLQYGGRSDADVRQALDGPVQAALNSFTEEMALVSILENHAKREMRENLEARGKRCTKEVAAEQILSKLVDPEVLESDPTLKARVGKKALSDFPPQILAAHKEQLTDLLTDGDFEGESGVYSALDLFLHPIFGVPERVGLNDIAIPTSLVTTSLGLTQRDIPEGATELGGTLHEIQRAYRRVERTILEQLDLVKDQLLDDVYKRAKQLVEAEMLVLDVHASGILRSQTVPDLDATCYMASLFDHRSLGVKTFWLRLHLAVSTSGSFLSRLRAVEQHLPNLVKGVIRGVEHQLGKDCRAWEQAARRKVEAAVNSACANLRSSSRQLPRSDEDCAKQFPRVLRAINVHCALRSCEPVLQRLKNLLPSMAGGDAHNPLTFLELSPEDLVSSVQSIERDVALLTEPDPAQSILDDIRLLEACKRAVAGGPGRAPKFSEALSAAETGNPSSWFDGTHEGIPMSDPECVARVKLYSLAFEDDQLRRAINILKLVVRKRFYDKWVEQNKPKEGFVVTTVPGQGGYAATGDPRKTEVVFQARLVALACWKEAEGVERERAEHLGKKVYPLLEKQMERVAEKRGWSLEDVGWIEESHVQLWLREYLGVHENLDVAWTKIFKDRVPEGVRFEPSESKKRTAYGLPKSRGASGASSSASSEHLVCGKYAADSDPKTWKREACEDFKTDLLVKHGATTRRENGHYYIQLPTRQGQLSSLKAGQQCTVCLARFASEKLYQHPHFNVPICESCLGAFWKTESGQEAASKFQCEDKDGIGDFCSWCGADGRCPAKDTERHQACNKCSKAYCNGCLMRLFGKFIKKDIVPREWHCPACLRDEGSTRIDYWVKKGSSLRVAPKP